VFGKHCNKGNEGKTSNQEKRGNHDIQEKLESQGNHGTKVA
jgi:hypothetical protein